jgi:hypothetical protein
VEKFAREKRGRSMFAYLRQRPDMMLETLAESLGEAKSPAVLQHVAAAYDQLGSGHTGNGWETVLSDRADSPNEYAKYAELRAALMESLSYGKPDERAMAQLTKQAARIEAPMVVIDAAQLRGIAYLLADAPGKASGEFKQAMELAQRVDAYQYAQLCLLMSDAVRREAKDIAAADQHWENAVTSAARMAARESPNGIGLGPRRLPLFDPVFWDKASYLRPVSKPWPAEVAQALRSVSPLPASDGTAA